MASAFGLTVTNLTSKMGIVSRKSSVRLATDTGKSLVDEAFSLGRKLSVEEILSVMRKKLPNRCIPEIIGSRVEYAKYLQTTRKLTEKEATQLANEPNVLGKCVSNGTKKHKVYIVQEQKLPIEVEYSFFAHELEHALEHNCTIKGILRRKITPLKKQLKKVFLGSKKTKETEDTLVKAKHFFELYAQKSFGTFLNPRNTVLSGTPTHEGFVQLTGLSEKKYHASIRQLLNQFINGKSKGSLNNNILNILKRTIDSEIPAYTVGGKVYEYAKSLKGQYAVSTGTALLYRDAQKIIKSEQKRYWFNKLFGKLSKPTIFQSSEDLINLGKNREERKIIKNIINKLSLQEQMKIFYALKENPNYLQEIKACT